ncbi:hypothetical protein AADQ08_24290 [Escherichia coli]|uniref:hypothetical protein n=1 Tax=Escherichia coli TaxID=562 RepID=UPI001DC1E0EB|nr:hypothetical protein [Escherichia coli]MBW9408472.1 hypothetical protein [Escherichia coli]MBW9514980.1 hypothetical protein [Escherichia coli]MBW9523020.1 hypothetical protein [Escherichia coli]MBW9578952.1 hypothetical protein [Escherichia coli]MDF7069209.1 hypothetical protein [Escherichia coli]
MRLTRRKKEILSYFEPDNREWVTMEIGSPPFDVSGVAYLLHSTDAIDKQYYLESTRRTLERVKSYERRQNRTQSGCGDGVRCMVVRYGLPGQCAVMRDDAGGEHAIDGEFVRIA